MSSGLLEDTTRPNLVVAWQERIEEADTLIRAGYLSSGISLKAYALEARIKLRICDHLKLDLLPRACKTHDLAELIIFTGLVSELQDASNASIRKSWLTLVKFSKDRLNSLRYQPRFDLGSADARMLIGAFDEPNMGVFAWLSRPR